LQQKLAVGRLGPELSRKGHGVVAHVRESSMVLMPVTGFWGSLEGILLWVGPSGQLCCASGFSGWEVSAPSPLGPCLRLCLRLH
jgi:hypothetical protein